MKADELHVAYRNYRIPEAILRGGNHLANLLIGWGLPIESQDADYQDVLAKRGQPYADVWACWSAIMRERDKLR